MCGIKTGRVFGFSFFLILLVSQSSESVVFVSLFWVAGGGLGGFWLCVSSGPSGHYWDGPAHPTRPPNPSGTATGWASHLDVLLHAELRQGLLDAQGGEPGRSVGVPALPHDLPHHTQRLHTDREGGGGRKEHDTVV